MCRRIYLILPLLILQYADVFCATYQVGSTRTYTSPNALYLASVVMAGDVIEIDAEDYSGTATLANWSADNLIIRGVGGKPHLMAAGQYILGKGIWVLSGDNITVENIEFSGTTVPSQNGAGIRLDGSGMTIRNCYFHDNENGILATSGVAGDILVEYTEFANNGFGNGFTHNIYVNDCTLLTFRFNYSHHAKVGHNLKSRADVNYIYGNRIMDEETGNSSRLIDISNGGLTIIVGNLLMQGVNAPNNNLVGYAREGFSNPGPHELYFINNTCVNKRVASCLFVDVENGTALAHLANNIFAGTGNILNGTTTSEVLEGNLIETDISALLFADEPNYDYHLDVGSPAINQGVAQGNVSTFSLTPEESYKHPTAEELRTLVGPKIDAGAYEQGVALTIHIVSFDGKLVRDVVELNWQTTLELNNAGFQILHAGDEESYHQVGWVDANQSANEGSNYSFVHTGLISGTNYYRLIQLDNDGSKWESEAIAVNYSSDEEFIFPNPTANNLYLEGIEGPFTLFDCFGRIIKSGVEGPSISVTDFQAGTYFLRALNGRQMIFVKI